MSFYTYAFEKLEVWQIARKMRIKLFEVSNNFPASEKYELVSQIRRASRSVCANLAEGSARATDKDRASYTNKSYASAIELIDHLICARDLDYIDEEEYISLRISMDELINKLNSYYKYQINRGKRI